jgi:pimeloyl-ACP methyl ester carboxylesterase
MRIFKHRAAGIDWYCELRGSGPSVVLIPSGEGDCGSFRRVAEALATDFTLLTFDMPGFSRSGPSPEFGRVTAGMLAEQIATLVSSLQLAPAAFYGCSSAGLAALTLVAQYPTLVRNALVHEAALGKDSIPLEASAALFALNDLGDAEIVKRCKKLFRDRLNSNGEAWDAVGEQYHQRLEKNYVTWVRHYLWEGLADRAYTAEDLARRPICWSVGGLSQGWIVAANLRVASRGKIGVQVLPCKHFPQIEIPELLTSRIRSHTKAHLTHIQA